MGVGPTTRYVVLGVVHDSACFTAEFLDADIPIIGDVGRLCNGIRGRAALP